MCFIQLLNALPRIIMTIIAICTTWFHSSFETWQWPLLGFFFAPYTTLTYLWAMTANDHQVTGGWVVLMVVAVLFDIIVSFLSFSFSLEQTIEDMKRNGLY